MTVTIRVPGYSTPEERQVRLSAPSVGTVVLPWWPDEISSSNLASVYEEQARPGRTPLLLRSGEPLHEVRIGCIVSVTNSEWADENVANVLDGLATLATVEAPIALKLASRSSQYRISDLGITELDWDETGAPTSAEVSLTLISASDAAVPVGPIKRKPSRPGKGKGKGAGNKPAHGGPNKKKDKKNQGGGGSLVRVD
jgi:hypothetical protein